jgi:hypothetical protein
MALNSFSDNNNSLQFNCLGNSLAPSKNSKNKNYNSLFSIAFLSLFMMLFLGNSVMGQVSITKPNLSIPVCSGFPTTYYNLGDIVIIETNSSNFSAGVNQTLILTAPANFEFKANTGSVSAIGGGDITAISSLTVSSTVITLTYTVSSPTNKMDRLTFSQLEIRAINTASTGNITRTGGTGTISGLTNGTTLTNSLTSLTGTPPTTANAGSNQIIAPCATTTTLAGNTPLSGTGAWSVISGAATITTPSSPTSSVTGLAIGATATLRWTISNGSCPTSTSDVTITTAVGPGCLIYCTPVGSNTNAFGHITNVNVNAGAINRTSVYDGYLNTGLSTTLIKGFTYTMTIGMSNSSTTGRWSAAWADWNTNGVLDDAGENIGPAAISNLSPTDTRTITFTVPVGSSSGTVKLRVVHTYQGGSYAAPTPCAASYTSQSDWEDYTFNVIDAPVCVVPTAQPTTLLLTPSSSTINGTFTAAVPGPNSYLVVASTSATPPTPIDGTIYSKGSTLETGGYLVVDDDNNTTFSATGLTPGTIYYFHVFSYNSLCTGGPLYNIVAPLFGTVPTAIIIPSVYCSPSTSTTASGLFIKDVAFVGTLQDVTNYNNSFSITTPGFQNFTALATKCIQAQGEGININVAGANATASNRGHWKVWVDWNKDGTFSDTVERVYDSGNIATATTSFGFIIPPTTAPGDYRIRIRFYNTYKNSNPNLGDEGPFSYNFTPCQTFGIGTSVNGYTDYGEAEDYLFTVQTSCPAIIKTVTGGQNCGTGQITLAATASSGTTSYKWYTTLTGGVPIPGATGSSYTTPSLSTTTPYYVTALNASCESQVRTEVIATVNPTPTLTFTPTAPEVCGEDTVLTLTASGDKQQVFLINENFENGLNGFSNSIINDNSAVNSKTAWQSRTSTFVPAEQVWFPAISSGFGTNKFVMATSDVGSYNVGNALVSPTINATNFLDLTLTFKMYYSRYYIDGTNLTKDYVAVEVSTNGGGAWTEISRYTADVGIGTRFETKTFNLNTYINQPNLKIRVLYYGEWCDGVAIDDVKLFGFKPLGTALKWTGNSLPNVFTNLACTIPYAAGNPAVTIYIKPTLTQLEQGNFTFTATALLSNGCSASTPISITNKSKVWKGTTSTDWNNSTNWLPSGIPTSDNCVIIPNNAIISGSNYDAYAKNLTVKATGNLDLLPTNNITVFDWVNVNAGGIFNVRNNASLVQKTDADNNIGIVNIQRISKPMTKLDYTYWNSPIKTSSGFTLGNLSANSSKKYSWIPTVSNGSGNWQYESSSTVMDPRKGYIVRAPDNHTTGNSYTATFIGTPNNGLILAPISKGTNADIKPINPFVDDEDDEWNLIGNPYPSGLSITKFIDHPDNLNVVDGTVYIWMHNTQPSSAAPDPFYGDYVLNYTSEDYATVNKTGGTATASTGGIAPTDFIASGQSFFIKSANTMPDGTTANATFNNSMRESGKNSSFAKKIASKEVEKNRIWLNLTNNSGAFSQILVGYLADATEGLDRGFDGENLGGNDVTFYSIIPEAQLTIQGRALPFDPNDEVRLGYNSAIKGSLSIRIDHTDGLINLQKIYLEDKLLKIIHNLREKPYSFDTEEGDFNDRFVLRYRPSDVKTETVDTDNPYGIKVIVNQNVTVLSPNELIKNIAVYDISGRKIDSYKKVDSFNCTLNHLNKTTASLILRITLDNDEVFNHKIIY